MPKQRNRQHHHAKSDRRGNHLELPTQEQFVATVPPRIFYPRGWKTKGPSEQFPIVLSMLALIGILAAVLILAALVMTFLPQ